MISDIRIYVACHKECFVPKHEFLFPIQVGSALEGRHFVNMLHDDTGDNISELNRRYCELTAHYWAWKNEAADYFGFFHYRRYLSFGKKNSRPYEIQLRPDIKTLEYMNYDPENMRNIIENHDAILPMQENMYVSAYNHYKNSDNHYIEDLDIVRDIICDLSPELTQSCSEYFNSGLLYFGNIFIMKKELFYNYCNWLFTILNEFDKRKGLTGDSRVNGYLGERLFGVYCTWLKKKREMRITELPRVHFEAYSGETDNFDKMRMIYNIIPPGTRRRSIVKRIFRGK